MMFNADVWFALSRRMRVLCWLLSSLCALFLLWWLVICPVKEAQMRLVGQQVEQHAAQQTQWHKLRALTPPSGALSLPEQQVFSPLDFQSQGRQLVRWQPAQGGGELELAASWRGVIESFVLLTERSMQVPAFSLVADEGVLRFTLRLEHDNAH